LALGRVEIPTVVVALPNEGPERAAGFASLQREEYDCAALAPAIVA
jgi:hypothetical protein